MAHSFSGKTSIGWLNAYQIFLVFTFSFLMLGGISSKKQKSNLSATRFVQSDFKRCSDQGAGTVDRPWCHLSVAGRLARPGDVVQIHGGTYREQMHVMVSGLPGKPIVYIAAPGKKVILDGRQLAFQEEGLLHIEKQRHIIIRGLAVYHSPFYGIQVSGSKHIVVDNNEVYRSQHGGIIIDQWSDTIQVLFNDVHGVNAANNPGGPGKSIHEAITISQTRNFNIEGNHVYQNLKEGIDAKDGSTQGNIQNNIVEQVSAVGIYLNHATQIKVFRNNIHHCGFSGIQLAVGDYAMEALITAKNDLFQNIIWKNGFNGIQFWQEKSGILGKNRIYNNVIYANKHSGVLLDATQDNIIVNNIIMLNRHHGVRGDSMERNTLSHNLFYRNRYGGAIGNHAVVNDPQFIAPDQGNFQLKPTSPAVDRGKDMGLPYKGKALDLGAWEQGSLASREKIK